MLVLGVGSSLGVSAREVLAVAQTALAGRTGVVAVATVDRRADEPGVRALADHFGVELRCYPADRLDAVPVPNPSPQVRGHVGTGSVAEAAALLAAEELGGGVLVTEKVRGAQVTVAVAELSRADPSVRVTQ